MNKFVFCNLGFVLVTVVSGAAVIDTRLKRSLENPDSSESVMVSFTQTCKSVIDKINSMNFSSNAEKRSALVNAEKSLAEGAQQPLQTYLNTKGVKYQSYWISNKMIIPNADSALVQGISNVPGVSKVEHEPREELLLPGVMESANVSRPSRQTSATWGVRSIKADQVWASYKGKGIVVGGIDSGVLYTHEALKDNWRSEYGWYDGYRESAVPVDDHGHGTHTVGTMVGQFGIGVAPEANWIHCRACRNQGGRASCGGSELFACGQWILCPTDPNGQNADCSKAPDIVSNSWGGPGGQSFYDDVINAWHSVGIIPVFANGNSGPSCQTSLSPGDRPRVISVGNIDSELKISQTSSLGPASDGRLKPDMVAPGESILSAIPTNDQSYGVMSGTSMACPHVSGVIALMKEKKKDLNYNQAYNALALTAQRNNLNTRSARFCGLRSPSRYPNHVFGYGLVDALESIKSI